MSREITHYRVFIASPAGLEDERKAFRDVLERFNFRDGSNRGVHFEAVGWEATLSQQGRPQAVLNEEVRSCDFFLLVLHDRWGSPPGDGRYTSGTSEELAVAQECLLDDSYPMRQISLAFKAVSERQLADPGPELSKVLQFKKKLEEDKAFIYQTFDDLSVFKDSIDRHLAQWTRRHETSAQPQTTEFSARPTFAITGPAALFDELRQHTTIKEQIDNAEHLYHSGKIVEAEMAFSTLVVKNDDAMALAKFGRFLRKTGNRHRATEMLTKALELAKMQRDKPTEAYATRQLGQLRERTGDIAGAIAQYGLALQAYQASTYAPGQARTHRDLALAHRKLGDYRRAIEHIEKSRVLYEELGDQNGVAAAIGYVGVLYKSKGDLVAARAAHLSAIDVQSKLGDFRGRAAAQSNLAIIHRMMGEYADAGRLHEEALATYRQQHDRQGESRELSNLGTLHRAMGNFDQAIRLHMDALAIAEQLQNKQGIAIQFGNLGRNFLQLGNIDDAEKYHIDALNLSKSLEDSEGQAWQQDALGHVEWKRGNLDAAERRFEKSLTEFRRLGAKHAEALSAQSLGEVLLARGMRAEAASWMSTARGLFHSQGLTKEVEALDSMMRDIHR